MPFQMLRELGLIGPGTKINTTDAEINYFHHASDRLVLMTCNDYSLFYTTQILSK